jgi:hypothetical protein
MSELVETALRLLLASQRKRGKILPLPKFRSGGALVDVADRSLVLAVDTNVLVPPMRTRNFMRPTETGSSANGRDRTLGTPPDRSSVSFCA